MIQKGEKMGLDRLDVNYPGTIDDVVHLLSCYIVDFLPLEVVDQIPKDFDEKWEESAKRVLEHYTKVLENKNG